MVLKIKKKEPGFSTGMSIMLLTNVLLSNPFISGYKDRICAL